jgi:hypothetical protein
MAMNDEWDGVCACGKAEMDGKRCALGATHQEREPEETPSLEDMLA